MNGTPDQDQAIGKTPEPAVNVQLNPIRLTENEVWIGMTVALCVDGKDTVELDEKSNPMIMQAREGGIPPRRKFYPIEDIGVRKDGQNRPFVFVRGMEGFNPNVRFMPVVAHRPSELPHADNAFVVFHEGKLVEFTPHNKRFHKDGSIHIEHVVLLSDKTGKLNPQQDRVDDGMSPDYQPPEDALLIPIRFQ